MAADFTCVEAQTIWRSAPSSINNELYAGFRKGNSLHQINEFPVGRFASLVSSHLKAHSLYISLYKFCKYLMRNSNMVCIMGIVFNAHIGCSL